MFEITGDHIAALNDSDLRRLVALLCEAELRKKDLPRSAVTAGGNQDAADGGLDVLVELPESTEISGFISRRVCGFQVKVPDMQRSLITREMCKDGVLRESIQGLADASGAYIIVSSKASTTDVVLKNRRQAMRDAAASLPDPNSLHVDFYDRERIATWVRDYASLELWVRFKVGQPVQGWQSFGNWAAPSEALDDEYILDDKKRIYDWRNLSDGPILVEEGIHRIRTLLAEPGHIVRLVGLSGTGKTRLVQALFDERIGIDALDRELVVYTDLGADTGDSCREMLVRFRNRNERIIVVVDNCPPTTHRVLAQICGAEECLLSLVTIEYDILEDEPEGTDVFRLDSASDETIERLLERRMHRVSPVDRHRIAEFSGGNARVAVSLANTVTRRNNLARLTDAELFNRLFYQRHLNDQSLLQAAQACSLLYSFDGEPKDGENVELPLLAELADISVNQLFRHIGELLRRGLVQKRGKWRSVLPQAIANYLARQALESISVELIQSELHAKGSERVWRSFSRRLGYLHDSEPARRLVHSWLSNGGILFDVANLNSLRYVILENVSPVDPAAVLGNFERALAADRGSDIVSISNSDRETWIRLLRSIAYQPELFHRASLLLSRFMEVEPQDHNNRVAHALFTSLFHARLSGTLASVRQRLEVVQALLTSQNPRTRDCGLEALDALLKTNHFSGGRFDFGAHPRDYGYQPKTQAEVIEWFGASVNYARDLAVAREPIGTRVLSILSHRFRELWVNVRIADQLEAMVAAIVSCGFWPDGLIAVRNTVLQHGDQLPASLVDRLNVLEQLLRPRGLVQRTRAYVFSIPFSNLDIADGEPEIHGEATVNRSHQLIEQVVIQLGRDVALDPVAIYELLPDLVRRTNNHGLSFGLGLSQGTANHVDLWRQLVAELSSIDESERNFDVLRGFLDGAQTIAMDVVATILDDSISDPVLGARFPWLQSAVEIGEQGALRLVKALTEGLSPAHTYGCLAYRRAMESIPPRFFRRILDGVLGLSDGHNVAIRLLSRYMDIVDDHHDMLDLELIQAGRELVNNALLQDSGDFDHDLRQIVERCFAGVEAINDTTTLCRKIKEEILGYRIREWDFSHLLMAIFRTQIDVALDEFLGDPTLGARRFFRNVHELGHHDLLSELTPESLLTWAQIDPVVRFPSLAAAQVPFFTGANNELMWTPLSMTILESAPNRREILEIFGRNFTPASWSGSLADLLENRRPLLRVFLTHSDPVVMAWAKEYELETDHRVALHREHDRLEDARFEL